MPLLLEPASGGEIDDDGPGPRLFLLSQWLGSPVGHVEGMLGVIILLGLADVGVGVISFAHSYL